MGFKHLPNHEWRKKFPRIVSIPSDDGQYTLRMVQSEDGDIWLSVIDEDGHGLQKSVRICTSQGAGVRKIGIRKALQDAMDEAEKAGFAWGE